MITASEIPFKVGSRYYEPKRDRVSTVLREATREEWEKDYLTHGVPLPSDIPEKLYFYETSFYQANIPRKAME